MSDPHLPRDGERPAGECVAEPNPELQAQLAAIKQQLGALPTITPAEQTWETIISRTENRPASRVYLALAATVLVSAVLTILIWNPRASIDASNTMVDSAGDRQSTGIDIHATDQPIPRVSDDNLMALQRRSQRLEPALQGAASAVDPTRSLRFRIADLDTQLARAAAIQSDTRDGQTQQRRLWQQRVQMLETVAEVRRANAVAQQVIY